MGGGDMPGSPTFTPHGTYNSKGVILLEESQVAQPAGAGLLRWKLHNRARLQGCVAGDGDRLVNEKDNQTYSLTSKQNETMKPGERGKLLGKRVNVSGESMFEVRKMTKDLGQCTATTGEQR